MNKQLQVLTLIAALGLSSAANAGLVSRLGGQAIYDTDLHITWLVDANYAMTSGYDADGLMNWNDAMIWAANLSYGGYTDWRLPTTLQPDTACSLQTGGDSFGYNCIGSEMGHLFYGEVGGLATASIITTHNSNYNLFQNLLSRNYWSGTEYSGVGYQDASLVAWGFSFAGGFQHEYGKVDARYAWAVRDGDVAAVPVPPAVWLFGSGLLGLIGIARRKARAA